MVALVASPELGLITAQMLTVDGGRMDYIGLPAPIVSKSFSVLSQAICDGAVAKFPYVSVISRSTGYLSVPSSSYGLTRSRTHISNTINSPPSQPQPRWRNM